MRIEIGPLVLWITGRERKSRVPADPAISIHWGLRRLIWVRFGRKGWRMLDERYPDHFGQKWHYAFDGWLSWRRG